MIKPDRPPRHHLLPQNALHLSDQPESLPLDHTVNEQSTMTPQRRLFVNRLMQRGTLGSRSHSATDIRLSHLQPEWEGKDPIIVDRQSTCPIWVAPCCTLFAMLFSAVRANAGGCSGGRACGGALRRTAETRSGKPPWDALFVDRTPRPINRREHKSLFASFSSEKEDSSYLYAYRLGQDVKGMRSKR